MRPDNEANLAEMIRGVQGPVRIRGGGTRPVGFVAESDLLDLSGLSGITLYEPGALTMVAQAGTPLAEIEAALSAEGQRLAFEPMDHRGLLSTKGTPTIGGVVAANVSGPRRIRVGAARDFLLGVRFVDGQGTVIKNGGRVMKNVTGYDLVKLLAGSYGTLGAMSEVSFKVLPKVESTGVVLINGLSDRDAVRALSQALGSPYEVSGAAHTPRGIDGHSVTMIRLEGFENSVSYRLAEMQKLLDGFGETVVERDPERTAAGWKWVRDVEAFYNQDGDVWRISVKPSDAPEVASRAEADGILYDWGGGLVWVLLPKGTDLRARLGEFGGHATLVRADDETKKLLGTFHPEPTPLAAISAGLRAKFDPNGIFNPGLMG